MKYLVMAANKTRGSEPGDAVELNRAVSRWVRGKLETKVFDCAYYVLPDRGMAIVNSDSHEGLLALLRGWPAYDHMTFEVYPLADVQFGIDNNYERLTGNREL